MKWHKHKLNKLKLSRSLPGSYPYSPFFRQLKIFGITIKLIFALWWDKVTGNNSSGRRHRIAKWLVRNILELGPTFIKIGQALSTRADLIPIEYIQEFGQLQDRVPPFSSDMAIAVIETELGKPISTLFAEFNPTPLAAASLGQVHKARLHTGEDVVIKVQRPGLARLFNLDFEILHRLVRWLNRLLKSARKFNLESIYREFFELLYLEIDYIHEGKNADRFRENFQNYQRVSVPQVYWQYTTSKILTLEYLPGIKIDNRPALEASQIDTQEVIQLGITCYLKQLLEDGFFQSDPHPGNMAVSPRGDIIFYDFGTMAEVKTIDKDQMIKTFFAVLKKDTDEVVETLIYMGLIEPVADMTPVKRMIAFMIEEFRDKPVDVRAFEQITDEVYAIFEQQPFRLPPQMTFIVKSLTTLDGIARALDPQYNLLAAAQPFLKQIAFQQQQGSMLGILARQTKDFIQYKLKQPNRTQMSIMRLESRLDLGELQVKVRSTESERSLKQIQLGIKSLIYTCLSGFSLLSGSVLLVGQLKGVAIALFCFATFWFILLLRSLSSMAMTEKMYKMAQK
ncbi:MAG TPA: AarF/ABC1/UbiB kinase family protein [Coleofasciculaceae cyanobacterium]|jgi:predicted unusual protein kinase regulating ubiquinone biosynthesis (AarF/ABC1/UbiB family)